MATFASFGRAFERDLQALHDHLWEPGWEGDAAALRASLVEGAGRLDAFLRTRGRLRKHASRLAAAKGEGAGPALFELLYHSYHLTAATERVRARDHARAGEHLARAVESMSIGLCSAAGCFPIVQAWESGRLGFEAYAGRLADALESKGVRGVGQLKRTLVAVKTFARAEDGEPPPAQRDLAARAAVANAAWCALASASVRRELGRPPHVPFRDLAKVVSAIASRV